MVHLRTNKPVIDRPDPGRRLLCKRGEIRSCDVFLRLGRAFRVSGIFIEGQTGHYNFTYNMNMAAPSVFSPPLTKPIPKRTIQAVAKYIAERFQPEEIILFGSYAYGKPRPSSDVDLLVVMETPKGELKTSLEILHSLPRITFSIDILARSRSTLRKRREMGDRFMKEITEKGKVLYARDH